MSGRLEGKVAIVTGGGDGLGKGIVTKFVKEGAKVLIADLSEERGAGTAKELGCDFIQANATKREDWEAVMKTAIDKYGQIDIVVNNAGASYSNKPTINVTDAEFDLCVDVNMRSLHLAVTTLVPYLVKQGKGGSFIQTASTAGIRPRPNLCWYNATKAAVINATKTLAVEYAKAHIRFNAVCPVVASTAMTHLFLGKPDTAENRAGFLATIPLGRMCTARDVGNACCYLASDEADYVTGTTLEVDGGRCV